MTKYMHTNTINEFNCGQHLVGAVLDFVLYRKIFLLKETMLDFSFICVVLSAF